MILFPLLWRWPMGWTITVNIPALDRLMNFLEGAQQKEIDALTQRLGTMQSKLAESEARLDKAQNTT